MEQKTIPDFRERLLNERMQLKSRIAKLKAYLGSPKAEDTDAVQLLLLEEQLGHMQLYLKCLGKRILLLEFDDNMAILDDILPQQPPQQKRQPEKE
jgi:hypothetical protein